MAQPDMDTAFQAALDAGTINGAILCATDAQGRFTYNKTLGERTLLSGEKRPQQLDDVIYLASATKLLASIAALQCVDEGLLSLTGDLSALAPELTSKEILTCFSEDGSDTPRLQPQARPITLEMLLTHSSGAAYHFLTPEIARWRAANAPGQGGSGSGSGEQKRTVENVFDYPLAFQPGTGWMYGPGLDWAGRIVERLTGQTLRERIQERILAPLGIADFQFYPVTREDMRARLVDLNPSDPGALGLAVLAGEGTINRDSEGDFGGHGGFMPAPDYLKVLRSLLANDGRILKPETVDDMFEHHLTPEATAAHRAALAGPAGMFFRVGTEPGFEAGHGLGGLLALRDTEGWYGEGTMSWGGGMTLTWFIDRKNDLCGVGAVQASLPVQVGPIEALKQTFREDIYRQRGAWTREQNDA